MVTPVYDHIHFHLFIASVLVNRDSTVTGGHSGVSFDWSLLHLPYVEVSNIQDALKLRNKVELVDLVLVPNLY